VQTEQRVRDVRLEVMGDTMKTMRWIFFLFFFACGGTVAGPLGDGGGTDGTTGSDANSGCTGMPPSCFCGSPVCNNGTWGCTSCGNDCPSLEAQLAAERAKLQACCPTCKSIQCMGTTPDVCCPITTNGGDTTAFSALVMTYKAQCKPICPGAPCVPVPSGKCIPSQMDPNAGRCL
jgi:hypothetical protein